MKLSGFLFVFLIQTSLSLTLLQRAGYKCETWFNISVSGEGQYRGSSAQLAVYVPPEIVYSQLENSDFSHIHNCNYE